MFIWKIFLQQILLIILQIGLMTYGIANAQTQDEMIKILADYDREASLLCNKNSKANWAVQTDVLNTSLVAEQVSESVDVLSSIQNHRCRSLLKRTINEYFVINRFPQTACGFMSHKFGYQNRLSSDFKVSLKYPSMKSSINA